LPFLRARSKTKYNIFQRKHMSECRWCGGATQTGNGPAARPEWIRWHCNGCGAFGYVNDPSPAELSQVYETAWQDSESSGTYAAGSTDEKIARSLLDMVCFSPTGCKCLDYGGGKGSLAKVLIEKGCERLTVFEPFGQNPGLHAVNWINDLNDLEGEKFDWIFMIEVLEHLLNPQEELAEIRRHLSPGGKLMITTPNARGWRARIDGFKWREAQNPTHINLFTALTLKNCLTNAGYSNAKRMLRPVTYKAKGLKALGLAMTQMVGVDGGLRFIATNSSTGE
jgi:SAM-dependent methyltransferase